MAFKAWEETAAAAPLELPILGKTYRIKDVGYLSAIKVNEDFDRVAEQGAEAGVLTGDEVLTLLLGDTYEQMKTDDVPFAAIMHAAAVVRIDTIQGRAAAEELWENGPNFRALSQALEKDQPSANMTTSPSTQRPARTSSTKKPASTRTTSSRTRSKA